MNLARIFLVSIQILVLWNTVANGSLLLPLLVKIIALKGALFIGTPIALGSFIIGQGFGFLAGKLAGGYIVLKAAQKYNDRHKSKGWSPPIKGWSPPIKGWSPPVKGWSPPVSHGHGWGWHNPKYNKGYDKGYGIGNTIAQFINQHKYKPSYHDYYDDAGGYGSPYGYTSGQKSTYPHDHKHHPDQYVSSYGSIEFPSPSYKSSYGYPSSDPSYGYPSSDPSYGYPSSYPSYEYSASNPSYGYPLLMSSYGYPVNSHGGFGNGGYPSASYGGYPIYPSPPPKEKTSFMNGLLSKLPTFLGGKPTEDPHHVVHYGPYSFNDGSYATNFGSLGVQTPMNTYYPYEGTHLPGQTYTPPKYTTSLESGESDKYLISSNDKESSFDEPETLFEDSEYTYSSSPYAKPKPKRTETSESSQNYETIEDGSYPWSSTYDGPAKQYTGVMTEMFEAIQKARLKSYGQAMGKPMGLGEYASTSPQPSYGGGSDKNVKDSSLHVQNRQYIVESQKKSKDSPNYFLEKFLEMKLEAQAKKSKYIEQRQEAKKLINLLRKAYLQQLAESLKSVGRENVEDEEMSLEHENDLLDPMTPKSINPVTMTPLVTSMMTPLTLSTTEKPAFLPVATVTWIPPTLSRYKREDVGALLPEISNPLLNLNSEQLEQLQLLHTFMEEIKQFFALISALDDDTCLQKIVCDIHTRKVKGEDQAQMTTYETNMITTFKIMDAILPFNVTAPQDSSTKYRLAAKIGEMSSSPAICQRCYSACAYTTNQIINLGNQVASATTQAPPPEDEVTPGIPMPASSFPPISFDRQQRQEGDIVMPKV